MKLMVPESLMVPLKVMLTQLKIKYSQSGADKIICQRQNDNSICHSDKVCDDAIAIGLPFHKKTFYSLVRQLSELNYLDYHISCAEAAAYVYQLDRWKARYDALAAEVKVSREVNFLNRHLHQQIVFAKSDYQRNEAVGLNLAKVEILEKQLPQTAKPMVALAGDVEILSQFDFLEAFGRLKGSDCNFYAAFTYRQLFSSANLWGEYLKELLPNHHRFRHQGKVFWESNSRCYDGMVFIAKDEATLLLGQEKLERCHGKTVYCLLERENDLAPVAQAVDLLLEKII